MQLRFAVHALLGAYVDPKKATKLWGARVAGVYARRLAQIVAAPTVADLYRLKAARLHPLTGQLKGKLAMTLTDQRRLILTISEGPGGPVATVEDVDMSHYGH